LRLLPTVAFAVGGVSDAVAHDVSGKLVATGDYADFTQAVLFLLHGHTISSEKCAEYAAQFSWHAFIERLRTFCMRILKEYNEK
jgi:phosphatidylinositol alpha-1,6-mannosyltransferase